MQVFKFNQKNGTPIRVQVIDKEPFFIAKDVCRVFGIANHVDAISRLDDDERRVVGITDPLGGTQTATAINESGLYHLIFQSRKPEEKKFRKWVTCEVLPMIRKTGGYVVSRKSLRSNPQPRRQSDRMAAFFDELSRWVTIENEKEVAKTLELIREHIHEVLKGRCQSVTVLDILTGMAKRTGLRA